MDIKDAYEFANKMRQLARQADKFGYTRMEILERMIEIAQNYEEVAERMEMDQIVQMQRDWVEAN